MAIPEHPARRACRWDMPAAARARSLVLVAAALALAPASLARAEAPAPAPAPDRMAKLVGLAEVWLEARVTHPAMLRGTVDLDAAAVAAIPKVEAARTKQAYAAAIAGMLAVFKDPATRVEDPAAAPGAPAVPAPFLEHPAPKLAVVTLAALANPAIRASAGMLVATASATR